MNRESYTFNGDLTPQIGIVNATEEPFTVRVSYADRTAPYGLRELAFEIQPDQGLLTRTGGRPAVVCPGDTIVPRMDGTWRVEPANPLAVVDEGMEVQRVDEVEPRFSRYFEEFVARSAAFRDFYRGREFFRAENDQEDRRPMLPDDLPAGWRHR